MLTKSGLRRHLIALVLLAPAVSILAEEPAAYVLAKDELPPAGTTLVEKLHVAMPKGKMKQIFDGTPHESDLEQIEDVETKTIVESPEKVIRQVLRSDHFWITDNHGEKKKIEDPQSPLLKERVISEKKDGKWVPHLESGKELDEEGEAELKDIDPARSIREAVAMYGAEPRKPGDKWKADLSKIQSFASLMKPQGELSAEFVKVAEVGGEPCAEIRFTFDLTGQGDDDSVSVKAKGERIVHRSLKTLTDRDVKTTENSFAHAAAASDQDPEVEVSGDVTLEETCEVTPG